MRIYISSSSRNTRVAYSLQRFFSECSAADMQTPGDNETGPSCTVSQTARRRRASESAEARERRLERQRARRRPPSCLRNSGGEAEPLISTPSSGQSTTSRPLVADKRGTPRANEVCSTASSSYGSTWRQSSSSARPESSSTGAD